MSKNIDWEVYEQRKAEIQGRNLSCEEYEKAIDAMVAELESEVEDE